MVPPVARYPSTSDGGVAILCPLAEALGARLAEYPIGLGDGAIGVDHTVTVGSLGTCLEGTASQAIGLGEVEQEGCTVATDHTGLSDQAIGAGLGVTDQGSEAGGGDDLEHGSRLRWWGVSVAPRVLIIAGRGWLSRVGSQFPDWHSVAVGDAPGAPAALLLNLAQTDSLGRRALQQCAKAAQRHRVIHADGSITQTDRVFSKASTQRLSQWAQDRNSAL